MTDSGDSNDTEAAMAAMGLPSNFSAPAFPRESNRGMRPPPPGPSNRGGRGRDGGWGGSGRGRGAGPGPTAGFRPPPYAPSGPAAMRGGHHQNYNNNPRGNNKRKRGGFGFQQSGQEGPLVPLEEVAPLYRHSFIEEDPWAHLS